MASRKDYLKKEGFLTTGQLAILTDVPKKTLRRWAREERITPHKDGRGWMYWTTDTDVEKVYEIKKLPRRGRGKAKRGDLP
ncbi:MAG: MerR family transcriptional regulator [Patescibacteria group bacterium]|nr:MerR family transcriptional regulator [Patescibacteria group bacterium]